MGSFPQPASTGMGVGGPSQQFDQQPAFPHESYGNNNNAPVSSYHVGGGPQFPHVQPAAGGEMNYFGNHSMPGSSSSHVGYPGPSPGMSMPGGPPSSSSSYSQPQPWTPGVGGPPGAPPSLPPRKYSYMLYYLYTSTPSMAASSFFFVVLPFFPLILHLRPPVTLPPGALLFGLEFNWRTCLLAD